MSEAHPCREELDLLLELATGAKTFEQVRKDALKSFFPGVELKKAVQSNASRGATSRLADLTGISENTLHHFPVRCKLESATEGNKMMHPFVLVSTMVEKLLQKDEFFFELQQAPLEDCTAASSFTNSPAYLGHPLVKELQGTGETVLPCSIYSDGIKVCCDNHPDTRYGIYTHRDHIYNIDPIERCLVDCHNIP